MDENQALHILACFVSFIMDLLYISASYSLWLRIRFIIIYTVHCGHCMRSIDKCGSLRAGFSLGNDQPYADSLESFNRLFALSISFQKHFHLNANDSILFRL